MYIPHMGTHIHILYTFTHHTHINMHKTIPGAGEMVQLLKIHTALAKESSLASSTHTGQLTTTYNYSSKEYNVLF